MTESTKERTYTDTEVWVGVPRSRMWRLKTSKNGAT